MTEHLPDGVNEITSGSQDSDEIMLLPSEMYRQPVERQTSDNRAITERQRGIILAAETRLRVVDELEAGALDYVIMRNRRVLPDGSDGADPGKLALFLQLDGFAQGGFESVYDPALGASTTGITVSTISELQLPELFGMWHLTVDQTNTKVVVFRGRNPYRHRFRLELMNTDASSSIHIEFVEVARRRVTAKEGGSNAMGNPLDQLGY